MLLFLHFVLVTYAASLTSAQVTKSRTIEQKSSLDGNVSNDHLLFLTGVSTKLGCASFCMRYNNCVAFSTSPMGPPSNMMECRVHDSKSISLSSAVAAPGSKTYFTESGPQESSWLARPCTTDNDCPATVANVVCFPTAGECLCQPGYYYSNSRDDCVADCDLQDLQATFLKYPKRQQKKFTILLKRKCGTYEEASRRCLNLEECRAFQINVDRNKCVLKNVTGTTGVGFKNNKNVNYYRRTCL